MNLKGNFKVNFELRFEVRIKLNKRAHKLQSFSKFLQATDAVEVLIQNF